MKLIKQGDNMGCGVACVAAVLGLSYNKASQLFPGGKAGTRGFICKEILQALRKGKLAYDYKYIKPKLRKKIYKAGTIVFIQRSQKYPLGHYLARGNNVWMDPWINFPEKNRKAGFRKKLPGHPIYCIFQILPSLPTR